MPHDAYLHLTLHEQRVAAGLRRTAAESYRPPRRHARVPLRARLGALLVAWGTRLAHTADGSPAGAA
ncbi:hypothetical protein I3F58_13195 [Streptomyces sp. MUM 203J]|uniref:hypothetical protein n=1 Tax=Streptomyces sp. MUM 203J TaxID=2791990 RepID=UPI001F041403|nr:hypothetical protein [Streptomyces sp. MUM 203J]MCH0540510.1 hypothetical protein [Streptomyces sp. MUM 203J]